MQKKGLFTSESVSTGHPDRLCDTVANAILTAILQQDPNGRAGIEALVTKDYMVVSGEVRYSGDVIDYEAIARDVVHDIGYTVDSLGFKASTFEFVNKINTQSPDIAQGVDQLTLGAGDQGIMFGYASSETDGFIPMTALLANALMFRYQEVRCQNPHLLSPDAKSQVTWDYNSGRLDTIVIAASHPEDVQDVKGIVVSEIIVPVLEDFFPGELKGMALLGEFISQGLRILINSTGRFVVCGPNSDAGVVGRKLVVDSYGGHARIGGGCTNGKDPSKVDASAARAARHAALNIVAAGLASECEIQLSYAIGRSIPVSVRVDTFETNSPKVTDLEIAEWLEDNYDFSVEGIINNLGLAKVDYSRLTYTGQFGTNSGAFQSLAQGFKVIPPTWESLDLVEKLQSYFN